MSAIPPEQWRALVDRYYPDGRLPEVKPIDLAKLTKAPSEPGRRWVEPIESARALRATDVR